MPNISIIELENLRKTIRVNARDVEAWEKLLEIGKNNISERGYLLITRIKFIRGLTNDEIEDFCEIRKGTLDRIEENNTKISKVVAEKLSKLGYPKELFIK